MRLPVPRFPRPEHRAALLALCLTALPIGCQCGDDGGDDDDIDSHCDPDEIACGAACCVAGSRCLGLICCPAQLTCGSACCNADHLCLGGQCTACPNELCLGQCCPEGWGCSEDGCCATEQLCGSGECCGEGRVCRDEQCIVDCGSDETCGPPGALVCCEGEEVCLREACVTPGDPCSEDADCDPADFCEPVRQRCLPRGDGGVTDAGPDLDGGQSVDGGEVDGGERVDGGELPADAGEVPATEDGGP